MKECKNCGADKESFQQLDRPYRYKCKYCGSINIDVKELLRQADMFIQMNTKTDIGACI